MDPFVPFLNRLYAAGVHVIAAVQNLALGGPPENMIDNFTPTWLGGPDTPLVIVGNVDENGKRFDTSNFLSSDQSKQFISLYAMGKQVAAPLARTNGQFMKASGASASTAFVSAILSIIMAEAPIGNPASSAAKTVLQQIAMDRKGTVGWPTNEETYFIPRMATSWEMECVDGPDADPFIAAFPTALPNSFTVSQMTVPAAQYTADAANSVSNGPFSS